MKTTVVTSRISGNLFAKLSKFAEARNINVSKAISRIIESVCDNVENEYFNDNVCLFRDELLQLETLFITKEELKAKQIETIKKYSNKGLSEDKLKCIWSEVRATLKEIKLKETNDTQTD